MDGRAVTNAPPIDDIYAPEAFADPYEYYGRLRETDPVYWNADHQVWLVTRYADVSFVMKNPKLFSSELMKRDLSPIDPPIQESDGVCFGIVREFRMREFTQLDPPEHSRIRRPFVPNFAGKCIERDWRGTVRQVLADLLSSLSDRGEIDLLTDVALPLPLLVIAEMLGFPKEDRQLVKELADQRMASQSSVEPNRMRIAVNGIEATNAYLDPMVEDRLRSPRDDLLSAFVEAERARIYSREEVLANVQFIIDAGHETTVQLVCNGMLAFLENRDQWEQFKAAPDELAGRATEECLRYDPPVSVIRRVATTDVTLNGQTIAAGQRLFLVIAAANRDPRQFRDPDQFDVERSPNKHLTFGAGIHVCLGISLARLEGQETFRALATRFPSLELSTDSHAYRHSPGMRCLRSLPLTLH